MFCGFEGEAGLFGLEDDEVVSGGATDDEDEGNDEGNDEDFFGLFFFGGLERADIEVFDAFAGKFFSEGFFVSVGLFGGSSGG